MNQGRFEQFGTPQSLYYQPASAFVAGFVGANNRYAARVVAQRGELAECVTDSGLALIGRIVGAAPRPGDAVELFVRPETVSLAREAADLAHCDLVIDAEVDSLLFDGANSSVLLVDKASRTPLRAALPQNGRFANLAPGEPVQLGLQVNQIWGYPAR
jgi:spermidine/putrescine transport system ATP-binding protein